MTAKKTDSAKIGTPTPDPRPPTPDPRPPTPDPRPPLVDSPQGDLVPAQGEERAHPPHQV